MDWKRFRSRVRHTLALLTTKASRCIVVNASMFQNGDGVLPFNIGDDLNYYLLKELTGISTIISYGGVVPEMIRNRLRNAPRKCWQ